MAKNTKTTQNNDKKKAAIIYAILFGVTIFVISLAVSTMIDLSDTAPSQDQNQTEDQSSDQDYYENFLSIESQEVLDFLSTGATGFLYVGRPTCPNCTAFVPTLSAVIEENNYAVIYYDTDAANADPDKKAAVLTALDVTGVPALMYIEKGQIIEKLSDRSKDSLKAFFDKYL